MRLPYGTSGAAAVWLERGLALAMLALPPLLALVPHAAAPLGGFAGLGAAGLVYADRPYRLRALYWPAALFLALLSWGVLSATWAIDPGRSLLMAMRLAGLFAGALALAGAAGRVVAPRSLSVVITTAALIGAAIALADLATAGGLSHFVSRRPFIAPRLNGLAVWLTVITLPIAALAWLRGQRWAALALAAAAAGSVCLLHDTTAKAALAASLPTAGLFYWRRGAVARIAAVLATVGILAAPLVLPRLDRLPGLFAAADQFKGSAGHRLLIWSFVGDRIAERPFAGWGLDSSRAIPGGRDEIRPGQQWLPLHPHNAALQLWLELGAPGAALLALFVSWLFLRVGAAPWPRLYAAAAGGGLTAAVVAAVSGWGIWEEWWLATLAFALFAIRVMARGAAGSPADATPLPPRGSRGAGR